MNRIALLAFIVPLAFALVLLAIEGNQTLTSKSSNKSNAAGHDNIDHQPDQILTKDIAREGLIAGIASVIDGDTIDVAGTRIRLHAIDAPEARQRCSIRGMMYSCGQDSTSYLKQTLEMHVVECTVRDIDRYGRAIAVCYVGDLDVGEIMVASGWALAYRRYDDVYVPAETTAKGAKIGLWRGEFIEPARWRAGERL